MKKVVSVVAIILMLSCGLVYGAMQGSNDVVYLESAEVQAGETANFVIDVASLPYDNSVIEITSSEDLSEVEIETERDLEEENSETNSTSNETENLSNETNNTSSETSDEDDEEETNVSEGVTAETESDIVTLTLVKDEINVSEILLKYEVADTANVGDKFTFTVKIINADDEEEYEEYTLTVVVVENTEEATSNEMVEQEKSSEMSNMESTEMSEESTSMSSKTETTSSMTTETTSRSSSEEETVTYNGSDNCYLSSLCIEGYEFTQDFSKDNLTYFVTVSDAESLTVTAVAEDSDATICIYGNTTISEGLNKILVTVNAENGNSKTYRIFVTCEEE